jgi:AraC family transcriptional regulator of arabinose operon
VDIFPKINLSDTVETPKRKPPGILSTDIYRKEYGYHVHRSKGTRDWHMILTLAGVGVVNNGTERFVCEEGDIIFISPGTVHDYYTEEGTIWVKMWCHFTPNPNFYEWWSFSEHFGGVRFFRLGQNKVKNQIRKAFERLIFHSYSFGPFSEALAVNALEEILLLVAQYQHTTDSVSVDPRIQAVVRYLEQNYMQQIDRDHLARMVCLSPSRLTHLFKERVGQSITDILLNYRLKQAANMLQTSEQSIHDICFETGFNSPTFFTRKFIAFYGVSPGQFRKRYKNNGMDIDLDKDNIVVQLLKSAPKCM